MFGKAKSSEKEICHVCGVSLGKLKKLQRKLDRKPKTSMISVGGMMFGVPIGAGSMYRCKKCGAFTCTDCQKKIERREYRTDYVCPKCDEPLGRESLVEM